MFLEHILRHIQKAISSLPDHFGIGVNMTSKNIFFNLGFCVALPQILGLGFSVFQFEDSSFTVYVCDILRRLAANNNEPRTHGDCVSLMKDRD